MILKQSFFVLLILLLYISCGEEDNVDLELPMNIEDCEIEEFHARMLINGECWTSTISFFDTTNGVFDLRFGNISSLTEELTIRFDKKYGTNTVFLTGGADSYIIFGVLEGFDALVVLFEPKYLADKEANWIEIDSINSDSSTISGRFETILYRNGEGNQAIYPSSEKLVITNGQFRVKRKE